MSSLFDFVDLLLFIFAFNNFWLADFKVIFLQAVSLTWKLDMVLIGRLILLLLLTTVTCIHGLVRASDFGISRRPLAESGNPREVTDLSYPPDKAAVLFANSSASNHPFPNIARLIAFDKKGQSFGSCSYIGSVGDYGIIVSNWHVICESDGLVHVYFPSGFSSFGAIVLFDRKWDLAVIVISKPPRAIPPLPIMQVAPRRGEPLWIAGYGSGTYRIASGYCVEYLAPEIPRNGTAPSYEIIKLSTTARQGDSGGPILNRNGELAGVLFGSDMVTSTAGSHCERVKWFLRQANPIIAGLPRKPEALFSNIEPAGPRHLLNVNQLITKIHNPIMQVNNVPATMPNNMTTEKAAMLRKNINNNTPKFINETNNTTNGKENYQINKSTNKSAQNNQTPNKTTENKHKNTEEKTQNEKFKAIEWAYDYETAEEEKNIVTKNNVVPSAGLQVVEEVPETKVAMAILHFKNDQDKNKEPIPASNINQNVVSKSDSDVVLAADIDVVSGADVLGESTQSGFEHGATSRLYVVGSVVVMLSVLFYLSLRSLKTPDNKNQFLDSSIEPEIIPIVKDVCQNEIVEPKTEPEKINFKNISQNNHRKHRKKAA
ncbi:MAG: serine protease [Planctomycetaceae bacterium]|nr:serine protease [Planctomycetaceae bacterium]